MAFAVAPLPFSSQALEPYMSKRTLDFHYGKHYKGYVDTLNKLTAGTRYEAMDIEDVVSESFEDDTDIFHNAAQAWNHVFFFQCLSPEKTEVSSSVKERLSASFGSVDSFKEEFAKAGKRLFGSGWIWLVKNRDDSLSIETLGNAGTPLVHGEVPLLVCDVWEHAYYLDYQNERPKFLENFWSIVNWDFVDKNLTDDQVYSRRQRETMRSEGPLPTVQH